jgi:predicted nucleic acid-binding protein
MRKKLLVDINIVLDVILSRAPWVTEAVQLLAAIENEEADGYVAGHTITTVYYIIEKRKSAATAKQAVVDLLRIMNVVALEHIDFQQALLLNLKDFEDAVQSAAALKEGCDFIVTRNQKDFKNVRIPAESPGVVLGLLGTNE